MARAQDDLAAPREARTLHDGVPVSVLHVVRHGEVENPEGILYGGRSGYHLTDRGRQMAQAVADHLAGRDVVHVVASPLDRTQETAAPIAAAHGLTVASDDRLLESSNRFEGQRVDLRSLLTLGNLRWMLNPLRPSWGEPYREIADRMRLALDEAREHAVGHEGVLVSHQLPIWMLRRSLENRPLVHHPRRRQCSLASVTSVLFHGVYPVRVCYAEPAAQLLDGALDVTGTASEVISR